MKALVEAASNNFLPIIRESLGLIILISEPPSRLTVDIGKGLDHSPASHRAHLSCHQVCSGCYQEGG